MANEKATRLDCVPKKLIIISDKFIKDHSVDVYRFVRKALSGLKVIRGGKASLRKS